MNLLDLRNAVKDRLAIRSDGAGASLDGLITNAYVNTSIDDALNRDPRGRSSTNDGD